MQRISTNSSILRSTSVRAQISPAVLIPSNTRGVRTRPGTLQTTTTPTSSRPQFIHPKLAKLDKFPDLLAVDPLLDAPTTESIPSFRKRQPPGKLTIHPSPLPFAKHKVDPHAAEGGAASTRLPPAFSNNSLHRFPLVVKRVVQQTGKGKIPSMYALVVVGNGRGLVGYGQGKGDGAMKAVDKAYNDALKRMDTVDLFENRTIWTNIDIKLGATRIVMRPRPVGFGLAVNPYLHQVCKAAGIKDLSAKVYGSRNGMQIIKAAMMVFHGGSAPQGLGDGVGGKGSREEAKEGMRSRDVIERERGRKLIEGSGWF